MISEPAISLVLGTLAVALAVVGLVRRGSRLVPASVLVLLVLALMTAWLHGPADGDAPGRRWLTLVTGVLAVTGGGQVTGLIFSFLDDGERVSRAGEVLRGGAWIGALERLAVFVTLVAGWGPGLAIVLAVKGLGRYPELRNDDDTGVAERFIIGTFTSVLWAAGCAGLAVLAP